MQLQIEAVHQPQGFELVLRHVSGNAAGYLVTKFGNARVHHRLVIMVIFIHVRLSSRQPQGRQA